MDQVNNVWQGIFFDFLLSGVIILLLFRLLQYLLPPLLAGKRRYRRVLPVLPLAETIVWLLYFSWFTFRFAAAGAVYALVVMGILLVLIFWISRFFLKDLLAGIFFRLNKQYSEGEIIAYEGWSGIIQRFGSQSLEVRTQEGQIVYIPYGKLQESLITKSEKEAQSAAYAFSIILDKKELVPDIKTRILQHLVSLPWSSVHKVPNVALKETQENRLEIEVTVYPIEKSHGKPIEDSVRKLTQEWGNKKIESRLNKHP
jgi:small-conductance mechanosensitive channel